MFFVLITKPRISDPPTTDKHGGENGSNDSCTEECGTYYATPDPFIIEHTNGDDNDGPKRRGEVLRLGIFWSAAGKECGWALDSDDLRTSGLHADDLLMSFVGTLVGVLDLRDVVCLCGASKRREWYPGNET